MIKEEQLEQLCLDWFKSIGYVTHCGYEIAPDGDSPERNDYRQIILFDRLIQQLQIINPHIPLATIEIVAHQIAKPEFPVLIKSNKAFHQFLLEGVKVEYKEGDKSITDHVLLVDFSNINNNQFLVVNQYTLSGTKGLRRPDILVFINGLPLAVIELKNPADESADIWSAYQQLQTYKDEVTDLFVFNEALVVSDGLNARVGSLTANKERFLPWRTLEHEDDRPLFEYRLETLVKGFFKPALFLDYIHYFVLFEQDADKTIKKIAAYHQFHAVREAVKATVIASQQRDIAEPRANYADKVVPGSGKAGVVWHTQGSGKSISMVCYASKLLAQSEMNNPTIVVVTDRNDLDGQLFNTFSMASETLKQTPVQAADRDNLRDILASRQSGGIIFTTVQKFALLGDESYHPVLSNRHNIVVVSDEAHRSQYGDKAKLNSKTGKYTFGYSKHMRDALPKASFIGFTGTPVAAEDKDTRAVFGDYVSIYDIQDAVDDGATVPIYYESRLAKLDINQAALEELNDEVEEALGEYCEEDEEDLASRESTKSKWATLEKLVGSEPRMEQVAKDLVAHYENRIASMPGKGMIVCMSREICVDMYNAIIAIKPQWHDNDTAKGAIKVVMTGSAADKEKLQAHIYNKETKKLFEKRFKDINDPLQLVIVRDMWLTGFDAPNCHTMYIDKPMKGHNLMQAIARVNRVFKDKPGGLVVDYIGIANELKHALKTYTDSKGKGAPTLDTREAYAILLEKMDVVRGMLQDFDYSDFVSNALQLLPGAMNHLLGQDDGKKRFLNVMAAISKAFTLSGTIDEAEDLKKEIAFLCAVKAAISKFTSIDKRRTDEDKNTALKQIIDNAIIADGVTDVFELVGLDKPNIGLLSDEFLEDVKNLPQKNLAMELLEKLLRDEIKARMKTDVVSEKKYSDRILETLRKYHNRAIETAQVIEELIELAKEMEADLNESEKLGLNPDEISFYRALIQNESAVRELGDNNLRDLAKYITAQLRKSTTVDWQVRDSVRAKLRTLVRRALKRWKYPPDGAKEALDLCLQQAEVLSNKWSFEDEQNNYPDLDHHRTSFSFEIDQNIAAPVLKHAFSSFKKDRSYGFADNISFKSSKHIEPMDETELDSLLKDPRNVPVWFGTNRSPNTSDNISSGFSDNWSEQTTLGRCIVNIPEGHVPGSTGSSWWIRLFKGDDRLSILSIDAITEDIYWQKLSDAMQTTDDGKRNDEALFFLHGYNVTFEQAAVRTAQLSYDLRIHPAVFFSWPSGGDIDDYPADEAAIEASYDSVIDFVSKLDACAFSSNSTLHVVAHSMGNRALLKALEAISKGMDGGKQSAIDKLVFAAPDVDARVFMQSLAKIETVGQHKTLYASQKDKAVWLSKVIHKYPRAGLLPPVTIAEGMDTIDATGVDETFLGHSYIASVRALIHDLSSLLKTSLPPAERVGLEKAITEYGKKYWRIK
jgi:type I restriction enzyme, R subunit